MFYCRWFIRPRERDHVVGLSAPRPRTVSGGGLCREEVGVGRPEKLGVAAHRPNVGAECLLGRTSALSQSSPRTAFGTRGALRAERNPHPGLILIDHASTGEFSGDCPPARRQQSLRTQSIRDDRSIITPITHLQGARWPPANSARRAWRLQAHALHSRQRHGRLRQRPLIPIFTSQLPQLLSEPFMVSPPSRPSASSS
ncbi:hypothetical protein RCH23_002765 [Cryobacterium sp. CAN_C3]|nr:hypothetical protein [Cryobacterium sp. CAN_C3]